MRENEKSDNCRGIYFKYKGNSSRHFLPEFMSNRTFDSIEARVIGTDCRYDMIIGRDALRLFKLNLLFKENIIEMEDISIPMRPFPENKKQ